MQKWSFDPNDGDSAVKENSELVFYIDDLNPEVIAKIVEIQNANPDGDFRTQVDQYLEGEDKCSPDEREFVLEQIDTYIKLVQATPEEVNNAIPQQPVQQGPGNDTPPFTPAPQATPALQQPAANTNADKGTGEQKPAAQTGGRGGNRQTGSRATGAGTSRAAGTKSTSSDDLIKQLEDKIALIKLIDKTPDVEVPDGLGKIPREIMVDFQREFNTLKDTFMERVKTM